MNGVTLAGTLYTGQVINTFVDIKGGLTVAAGGSVSMSGNGELIFLGSQTLSGTGIVNFADNLIISNGFNPSGLKGLYVPTANDTVTVASGVTIHGVTGFVGSTTGGFVTNNGVIASDGGGTITIQSATNYAGGTLTGGTWEAENNSILKLNTAAITTNAAAIVLDGANSHFSDSIAVDALSGLSSNMAGMQSDGTKRLPFSHHPAVHQLGKSDGQHRQYL